MSEWKEVLLQDVVSILGDGLHGTPEYDDNGDFYFINGNNLSNGKIVIKPDTKKTVIKEYEKYKKNLNERTILLSINGTLGNIAYYNGEKCILGKSACYFNVLHDVDKEFIRYIVTDNQFQSYIDTLAHGSTIKNVSLKTIREYPFPLPPLPEQKAIAGVLSSLDDKIDLLQRQNKTLEGMAEALWRKMFVEDADESWIEGKLCDIVSIKYGKDHKKLLDGAIPAYGSGGVMRYVNTPLYSKESVLIPRKGSLNNVVLIDVPFWTVDTMFYTEMKIINAAKYIYYFVKSQDLASMNVGSAVPSMTTDILNNMEILIPPDVTLKKFEEAVSPLFTKLKLNNNQIYSLEKHRNILLSKLMSGEVRVKL